MFGHVHEGSDGDRVLAQDKLQIYLYALIGHPTVGSAIPNTP
jgi:hypothetical protein